MALGKRKPFAKWHPYEVLTDVETAFYGDTEKRCVPAAAVLRYAYDRMSKKALREWEADAEKDLGGRRPSHGVFKFDFAEDDREALYMEYDKSGLIREVVPAFDLEEARSEALSWVGDPNTEVGFWHLPGIYQSTLIEAVTGVERDWNVVEGMWWFPDSGEGTGQWLVFREYPPKVVSHEESPVFRLMEAEVIREFHRQFLLSPEAK